MQCGLADMAVNIKRKFLDRFERDNLNLCVFSVAIPLVNIGLLMDWRCKNVSTTKTNDIEFFTLHFGKKPRTILMQNFTMRQILSGHHIPPDPFYKIFVIVLSKICKICWAFAWCMILRSGNNCAHATTVKLSWYVQNYGRSSSIETKLNQIETSRDFVY